MSRRREQEARAILTKYHGDGDPEHEIVQLEMEEISEAIDTTGTDKIWWDYRGLFNSRGNRHRMGLVLCVNFFGQLNLPLTSYYLPLMAQQAGIKSEKQRLLMNALQSPIMTIGTLLGIQFIDTASRRPMLMGSSSICPFCVMMVIICFALPPQNSALGLTSISFVYVFLFAFAFVWTPCQALYPSEVLACNVRTPSNTRPIPFHYLPDMSRLRASSKTICFMWSSTCSIPDYSRIFSVLMSFR